MSNVDARLDRTYARILKTTALIGGSSVVNIAFGIVRTKAMALLLGPSGVGLIGLYTSVADLTERAAGLGLPVGGPAINSVPRRNIEDNVRAVGAGLLQAAGLEVTISVPQGVEMAKKTLNARLGILGGISILGTTGIVKPYSTSAYRASVVQGVQVAATLGHGVVVLTTGGRTEQFAMKERPGLPPAAFVQMGDFLRYALDTAVAEGLREVVIGGMVGKLTKIAQGETITHANRAEVDTGLLAELAANLKSLYEYMATRLLQANLANDDTRYAEVAGMLGQLHEAWQGIAAEASGAAKGTPASNAAAAVAA